ncbi:MAG: response regulator [Bacteroidia bacterium]
MYNKKILLVDDDADDQLLFMDAVQEVDMMLQCEIANNGIEALHHLHKMPPPPVIIFLDLNMPLMNGFECLETIRKEKRFSGIPVIIFTTSNNPADHERAKKLGANDFFTKTADFKELKAKLHQFLKTES